MLPTERYKYIRYGLRMRGMDYRALGNEIGYCEGHIKRSMHNLRNGRSASRFFLEAVENYFERTSNLKTGGKTNERMDTDRAAECGGD